VRKQRYLADPMPNENQGRCRSPRWVFDYESGYRFGSYMFLPGEYDAPRYED
jgi:hypothetical protein